MSKYMLYYFPLLNFQNLVVGDSLGNIHVIHIDGLKESANLFARIAAGISKVTKLSISEWIVNGAIASLTRFSIVYAPNFH